MRAALLLVACAPLGAAALVAPAAAPAVAAPAATCDFLQDTDYDHGSRTGENKNVATTQDCCNLCAADPNCAAAVFGSGSCWFKTEAQVPKKSTKAGAIACVPKAATPAPPAPASAGGGCGGGCIFLIVFFGGGVAYFAVGTVYNYKARELRGREALPHAAFWADLPLLVKDGAAFVAGRVRGGGGYSTV